MDSATEHTPLQAATRKLLPPDDLVSSGYGGPAAQQKHIDSDTGCQ
jgi:hypothetical protein